MSRYVEADKLKKSFNLYFGGVSHAVIANQIIDAEPTADVQEVKHSWWIESEKISQSPSKRGRRIRYKTIKCNNCKKSCGRSKTFYCPNCGAKMDGEE